MATLQVSEKCFKLRNVNLATIFQSWTRLGKGGDEGREGEGGGSKLQAEIEDVLTSTRSSKTIRDQE